MRRATKFLVVTTTLFLLSYIGLQHVYAMGVASVQIAPAAVADDSDLLILITTGKYIPAVGIFLIMFVTWMRSQYGLAKLVPWFASKPGGWLLGYGSAALLYIGTSWRAGAGVSVGLLGAALAAGWSSTGGWEHLKDILELFKPQTPDAISASAPSEPAPPSTLKPVARVAALAVALVSCNQIKSAGNVVIDCAKENQGVLIALTASIFNKATSGGTWSDAEQMAKGAGARIGGCALAEAVQRFLGGNRSLSIEESNDARASLEHFRITEANGATFKTAIGEL